MPTKPKLTRRQRQDRVSLAPDHRDDAIREIAMELRDEVRNFNLASLANIKGIADRLDKIAGEAK